MGSKRFGNWGDGLVRHKRNWSRYFRSQSDQWLHRGEALSLSFCPNLRQGEACLVQGDSYTGKAVAKVGISVGFAGRDGSTKGGKGHIERIGMCVGSKGRVGGTEWRAVTDPYVQFVAPDRPLSCRGYQRPSRWKTQRNDLHTDFKNTGRVGSD
ncbi:hypothetical protein RRG08_006118 [Elysia crispata]|uniref:Uncharacterized protein n=1 Tax=Elysia crispata TaxID=231223 RepID=A0AAE1DDI4_9GAST|nr:hypothetical protein RRG08_006118 [Elysia crispata]